MIRRIFAIVPAAGVGSRMQSDRPKQYLHLLGKTILQHTLEKLLAYTAIEKIIVAVAAEDPYLSQFPLKNHPKIQWVIGGKSRDQSVLNALNTIDEQVWVMVHDAARPCITHQDLDKLCAITDIQGAILAKPVVDTIKKAFPNRQQIEKTEDRSRLWHALTPQFFPAQRLKQALQYAHQQGLSVTDEASALELIGDYPQLVSGRSDNIKITRPEDLALAEFYLQQQQKEEQQ
ncbi:2-C-methyl-D-erythritol 4-phosphate cytidylyltransferase [Gallibacterium anatis]|uniref:2-C-methyl-D-erythritol 4-phosphate cytidylyltransferase n=1 Tax=Gallibacterium anatis TaxID=750 RepID=A0AAX3XD17_9PAST|nr:2-C-methyl-D-erythritol 4-phosphate cytidylyltransferase [Gallibacterium anatis]KGQ45789.1 2-C-methyl-D-erythritol 4-phosphate cytidylyltransferase [Gallibacterium anatis]KGQ55423.1 2-C-methyl-D-erythritol 4-phosphate cytidylyltransferase [Gallibacterium anatis str. Avicor]KGQ64647.1 2-C-methyl-D-erythritol 4-phosphate cytidylyltransferase [Gallibacterium anatis 7990]MBP4132672.1 2-C-methyl-D-erythritol 4-phosphate cytidylyltransferase [Gallibacterium anatis]MDK9430622.1 2-C-methyl-D-erythr